MTAPEAPAERKAKYRCPYCKTALDEPNGKCPACGKMLRPPQYAKGAEERRARKRKIGIIKDEAARKGASEKLFSRSFARSPAVALVAIMALSMLGLSLMNAMRKPAGEATGGDRKMLKAMQGADTIAEALGRFKFHTGAYPLEQGTEGLSALDGIAALVMKEPPRYKGALGPYLRAQGWIPGKNGAPATPAPIRDPWGNPYAYTLSSNGAPSVVSAGPDGKRGTADDVMAHPEAFEKPFRDVSWTNDWVHYTKRGIIVKPTPPGERIVEDNGEALFPWLLGGVCVLGGLLLVLVGALVYVSRTARRDGRPATGAAKDDGAAPSQRDCRKAR